jgi:hypothetical protein
MFFAGRLPRPPWETRGRVAAMVTRLDRRHLPNYGQRFRFTTLQTRAAKFFDLWDRALRAREEGRPGPFAVPPRTAPAPDRASASADRVLKVATFTDPAQEAAKLRDLYDSLTDARREAGQDAIPFQKFAELVTAQVTALRQRGGAEVAFRVALKDGKVAFTARALTGAKGEGGRSGGD